MRGLAACLAALLIIVTGVTTAAQAEDAPAIPERVEAGHWSCQSIEQLGAQYQAPVKCPASVVDRRELAESLMTILGKVAEHCEKGGAVAEEDRQRLDSLYAALHVELERMAGYTERRDAILRILSKPDETQYSLKAGMVGYLRGEGAGRFRVSDASPLPGHREERFVHRIKPYVYWHPEDYIHLHLEGQAYGYRGDSQHFDKGSLYQGFVELNRPGNDQVLIRGGRQEFVYGSAFILGSDSFNDGLSFDGGLIRLKPLSNLTVDLLLGRYARPFSADTNGSVGGVYTMLDLGEGSSLDAYWLKDTGVADRIGGEYLAHAGLRGVWQKGDFTLELEPVFARGRVRGGSGLERTEAYGGHVDASLGADLYGRPGKLQFGYAMGSGSQSAANGGSTAREFSHPNHDSAVVGDLGLFCDLSGVTVTDASGNDHHASGLHAFSLGFGVDLTKTVNFSAAGRYFRADAVEPGVSKRLGFETDAALTWATCDYFSLIAGYDRFYPGPYFRDLAGVSRPIQYGYVMATFDVSKSWVRKLVK